MITVASVLLLCAAACFGYRLLAGPSLADRVLAVDGLLVVGMGGVATHAVATGIGAYIPAVVVAALIGFISTSVIARFIEGRGR
ncbi:MAG: cation:proton antiporter [Acidimicrobiales bacterium]|nr:cation:proton antiporter [Acidimicrobiales bacterium]